jgi:hypothetical protein
MIEVSVYIDVDGVEVEKIIEVLNYTYRPARRAILRCDPDDCRPPEGEEIEDVDCRWKDGIELTVQEWDKHSDTILEAISQEESQPYEREDD